MKGENWYLGGVGLNLDGEASGLNMNIAVWRWEMDSCCHRGDSRGDAIIW